MRRPLRLLRLGTALAAAGIMIWTAQAPAGMAPVLSATINLRVYPNPAAGPMRVSFAIGRPAYVRLTVHNVAGGLVRVLADGPMVEGQHEFTWDARTTSGQRVPSGFYWLRLEFQGRVSITKVWFIR